MTDSVDPKPWVAIIEPVCWGLEHVPFNAALVAMTAAAIPDAELVVYGEGSHVEAVRSLLEATRPEYMSRVRMHAVPLPPRKARGITRLASVKSLFDEIARSFNGTTPAAMVVATLEPAVLAILKIRRLASWRTIPTVGVFHELLKAVEPRQRSRHRSTLKAALLIPHAPGLRFMVLSEHILPRLRALAPAVANRTFAVDHPSLLGDFPQTSSPSRNELRFGFVGGGRGHKGFADFIALASTVCAAHPGTKIEIVGSAPQELAVTAPAGLAWSTDKLPLPEFVERLRNLSHVIWLGAPHHYDFVASGSLVDAIVQGVPVICQAGPFVNHLFERLGNIGVTADTPSAMCQVVLALIAEDSRGMNRAPLKPLADTKAALSPEAWAPRLRDTLRPA